MTYVTRSSVTTRKRRFSAAGLCILFAAVTTACAGPAVLSTPNSCSSLLPSSWKEGVAAPDLPADDSVGSWITFGDAAVGKLDVANGRTKDAIEVVSRCEARDAASVRRASKSWLGRLFD